MSNEEHDVPDWAKDADIDTPDSMPEDGQGQSGAGGPRPDEQHHGAPPENDDQEGSTRSAGE